MFKQEGYDFMAAAFEVYNEIGYGMAEEIYQQSLEIELSLRKIPFLTKQELEVYYKGHKLTTCYKPDLLVFGGIVVELKAVTELLPEHEAQLFNYLRVSRMGVGYLATAAIKATFNGSVSSSVTCTVGPLINADPHSSESGFPSFH